MNNKVINALSILCLIVVIGIMSWRDMNPKSNIDEAYRSEMATYYAGANITPEMIPDDSMPITIAVGEFSYTPDGKTVWKPQGMPATTFAQRQINLQFHFNGLPHNPAETIEKIKAVAEDWKHKGDDPAILILDYSAEKPDLKSYAALLKTTHDDFKKNHIDPYTIYSVINIQWLEGSKKEAIEELQDDSTVFLVQLPQAHISEDVFSKLDSIKHNLALQFPSGTQLGDLDMPRIKKISSLIGVTLTLDPHKPIPKKEEKIGLFPKL